MKRPINYNDPQNAPLDSDKIENEWYDPFEELEYREHAKQAKIDWEADHV